MKNTSKRWTEKSLPNHKGNYKISVSFDVFSDCPDTTANKYVDNLFEALKLEFFKHTQKNNGVLSRGKAYRIKIKNETWNE